MATDDEILFANEVFYAAFRARDSAAMGRVWATTLPVLCIHPGLPPLTELAQVLASWREILGSRNCPILDHQVHRVLRYGDVALVTCYEWSNSQPEGALLATNGFAREGGVYRMVVHHAGPVPRAAIPGTSATEQRIH